MKILGIDPGLIKTGYGLIDVESPDCMKMIEAGVIRTSSEEGISSRVKNIYNNIDSIIKEHRPSVLVLEKLYAHYKHPATSILMGHARGVVCLACGHNNVKLVNYPATRIKKCVTGNGRAGKHQVQSMVKSLLNLNTAPDPFDVSDALAMAISYVYMEGQGSGITRQELEDL